ncbi:hypothetical protein A4A49_10212 [Nicotiana attenuata]|uniref:Uncharacterized protein n=1 Tax=Nicotiana attenuata TaxID=49451 RepID=A0A1J6IJC9_NICAT|nr:hypothetical protein A4A49_10212 [Nicotiana attenuata]
MLHNMNSSLFACELFMDAARPVQISVCNGGQTCHHGNIAKTILICVVSLWTLADYIQISMENFSLMSLSDFQLNIQLNKRFAFSQAPNCVFKRLKEFIIWKVGDPCIFSSSLRSSCLPET